MSFLHQVRHGVPADMHAATGHGFPLAPPSDKPLRQPAEVFYEMLGNLVGLCAAQGKGSTSREVAVHSVAYALLVYGYTDHEEAAAIVRRLLAAHCTSPGKYNTDRIVEDLMDRST